MNQSIMTVFKCNPCQSLSSTMNFVCLSVPLLAFLLFLGMSKNQMLNEFLINDPKWLVGGGRW